MNKPRNPIPKLFNPPMAVIPFGYGLVMSGIGIQESRGNLFVVAVPDDLVDMAIEGQDPTKSQFDRAVETGAPMAILHFKDRAAIDRLRQVLDSVEKAFGE